MQTCVSNSVVTKFSSWYDSVNKVREIKSPFNLKEAALYNQKRQLKIAVETCKLAHRASLGVNTPIGILTKLDTLIWKLDTPGLVPTQEMFTEVLSGLHLAREALSPLTIDSIQNLLDVVAPLSSEPVVDADDQERFEHKAPMVVASHKSSCSFDEVQSLLNAVAPLSITEVMNQLSSLTISEPTPTSLGLDDLPHEILLQILSFTSAKTVARMGMANHWFHLLCQDQVLWKRFVRWKFGESQYLDKLSEKNRTPRGDYVALLRLHQANLCFGRWFRFMKGMFASPLCAQAHASAFKRELSNCVVQIYRYTDLECVTEIFLRVIDAIRRFMPPNEACDSPILHILVGSWLDAVEAKYHVLSELTTHIKLLLSRCGYVRRADGWRSTCNEPWMLGSDTRPKYHQVVEQLEVELDLTFMQKLAQEGQ
jgi:F-box-like